MVRVDTRIVGAVAGSTANQALVDRTIRHSLYLERLKATEVRRITNFLGGHVLPDVYSKVEARLAAIAGGKHEVLGTGLFTTQRYQAMLVQQTTTVRYGVRRARELLAEDLHKLALTESEWQAAVIADQFKPLEMNILMPDQSVLRQVVLSRSIEGKVLRDYFKGLESSIATGIRTQIKIGVIEGETVDQIARRIRVGAGKKAMREARTITRTSVNHVSNNARQSVYEANRDVVKGWKFVATLDSRTTEICAAHDGKVFRVGEGGASQPPLHHQCRSTTVPVLKSWDEMGLGRFDFKEARPAKRGFSQLTKADRAKLAKMKGPERRALREKLTGQVPADKTFIQWMREQPVQVQNEWLGKGKADLFRQGKYTPTIKNTLGRARPITLRELRGKEKLPVKPKKVVRKTKPKPKPKPKPTFDPKRPGAHLSGREVREKLLEDLKGVEAKKTRLADEVVRRQDGISQHEIKFLRDSAKRFKTDPIPSVMDVENFVAAKLEARGIMFEALDKHPEMKAAREAVDDFWKHRKKLQAARDEVMDEITKLGRGDEYAHKLLKVADPMRTTVINTPTRGKAKDKIERARKFLQSIFSRKQIKGSRVDRALAKHLTMKSDQKIAKALWKQDHGYPLTKTDMAALKKYAKAEAAFDDVVAKSDCLIGHTQTTSRSAWENGAVIHLNPATKGWGVYVHEMAHAIEEWAHVGKYDNGVLRKTLTFLKQRVEKTGAKVFDLNELMGGGFNRGFGRERAFAVRRMVPGEPISYEPLFKIRHGHHYTAKVYNRGGGPLADFLVDGKTLDASEVLSMGLEELAMRPVDFAKNDPEFFDFLVDLIRGRIAG